jgi:hypothetical protein
MDSEGGRYDEALARDLICIRVVEKLHESGFYTSHPEEILETLDRQPVAEGQA